MENQFKRIGHRQDTDWTNLENFQEEDHPINDETHISKRKIILQVIPASLGMFFSMTQLSVNLLFLGHLKTEQEGAIIAGVGLATMLDHMLILAPTLGLNSALETLVSQAYGYGNLELCGVYLNRSRFILTIYMLLMVIVLLQTEKILIGLNQNPEAAKIAQEYIRI